MGFEITSAVSAPVTSSVSVERSAASPSVSEPQSNTASSAHGYSVTSADNKRPDSNQSNGAESGTGKEPTEKQVKSTIAHANNELKHAKTGLNFKYHEATRRVSITVYDKDTDEIIREIPPEKSLDMLEKMWELAGMVVDDRR